MARRTAQSTTRRNAAAKRLKIAAAKDERLLEEIHRGLDEEKKSGRVPLREIDGRRARHGGV
jgi:hypothetical protein